MDWVQIAYVLSHIAFFTTVLTETGLITITLFFLKRSSFFGTYKYLIITFSTFGIIFACIEFVEHPLLHAKDAGWILFSLAKNVNQKSLFFISAFAGAYSSTICLLAVHFLYRYWAIFDTKKLGYFQSWRIFLWFFYAAFFGFLWGTVARFGGALDDYSAEYMRTEVLNYYNRNITDIPCLAFVFYEKSKNSNVEFVRLRIALVFTMMTSITCFQYGIMIYCGVRMHREMDSKIVMMSARLRRLHKQMFKSLVLQITVPTFTLFLPAMFTIYLPIFNLKISVPSGAFLPLFTLYPSMDVFIMIFIITDYRKILTGFGTKIQKSLSDAGVRLVNMSTSG